MKSALGINFADEGIYGLEDYKENVLYIWKELPFL